MTKRVQIFAVLSAAGFAIACGGSPSSTAPTNPTQSADVTITIQGNRGNQSFAPNPATVRAGQTVAWRNADSSTHNATQDANRFATINLGAGATSSPITMSTAGTFTYHCSLHPGMVGTLTVQ
jgi:plastocyanin